MTPNEEVGTIRFTGGLVSADFKIDCVPLMAGRIILFETGVPCVIRDGLHNPP